MRGVHVADGTLVFDAEDGEVVRFIPGLVAEHDDDLPADWRARSQVVARMQDGGLVFS
jgi:hypothetical protein